MIAHAISINRTIRTCVWVLPTMRPCGQPVRYTIVLDDDSNRVRSYDTLCLHHRQQADARKVAGKDES